MSDDTDILLALLISLLPGPVPSQAVLLEVLADCEGDVEAAARKLQTATRSLDASTSKTKRKREILDLDDWLVSPSKPLSSGNAKKRQGASSKQIQKQKRQETAVREGHESDYEGYSPRKITVRTSNPSSSKATLDLKTALRPPPSAGPVAPRLPPLALTNPAMVVEHVPCTLHPSILPPELACRLFYTMIDESEKWGRNKWFLFDRVVESPHRTSFYVRRSKFGDDDETWSEAAQFWYNGRKAGADERMEFPQPMEEACEYIEKVVNEELRKRARFALEWGGADENGRSWVANVAASNRYEGAKETVGLHSDQLTNIGPYATIASLSLGTSRKFRLREVIPSLEADKRSARTYDIPLTHNSLVIMHASMQERFKHAVPPQTSIDIFRPAFPRNPGETIEPSTSRINITFRFYRPDYGHSKRPRCKCDEPMILRPDMKNKHDGKDDKYWWTCYAGAQNNGKTCNMWQVMDVRKEGRGPFMGDLTAKSEDQVNERTSLVA